MNAYSNITTEEEKKQLLKELTIKHDNKIFKMGPKLSERVYEFFHLKDPQFIFKKQK